MNVKDQIVSKVSSFPTLPAMAGKLLNLLNNPEISGSEIARVVQYDPALAANLMKAANSVYLGVAAQVQSINEAIFRLGSKWIFQVAVSSLIYSNLHKPVRGYDLSGEELWRHCIAVATMSDIMSRQLKIKDVGLVFTGGLLHDMGKIIMGEFVSDKFDDILKLVDEKHISFEEAEREILGIDHAEIGGIIAENWKFPVSLISCIRYHHDPDLSPEADQTIDIVHIADALCLMQGYGVGRDGINYKPCESAVERLGLTTAIIEQATSQLVTSLEEVDNALKSSPAPQAVGR